LAPARSAREAAGYTGTEHQVNAASSGDVTAHRRGVTLASKDGASLGTLAPSCSEGVPCVPFLINANKVPHEGWLTSEDVAPTMDPRIPKHGGAFDVQAASTAQASAKAGMGTHQNEDRIWDRMQRQLQAWRLSPERPSSLLDHWRRPEDAGHTPFSNKTAQGATREKVGRRAEGDCALEPSCPADADRIAPVGGALAERGPGPAGERNTEPYDSVGGRRCGSPGPGRPRRARPPETFVRQAHLRGAQGASDRHGPQRRSWVEKVRTIMGQPAAGTRRIYAAGWRRWRLFCDGREVPPLRLVRKASRRKEEDRFLDFVVHLVVNQHLAPCTIKTYLIAVRAQLMSGGRPDLTTGMARLRMAMKGLKHMRGTPTRKKLVTVRTRRAVKDLLDLDGAGNGLTSGEATLTASFLLSRSSVHCGGDAAGTDMGKGLRSVDIKREGVEIRPSEAHYELVSGIRRSETDQYNRGEIRNLLSGDAALRVVTAMARHASTHPDRYRGEGAPLPLFPGERRRGHDDRGRSARA
jgi:hypothetical protein